MNKKLSLFFFVTIITLMMCLLLVIIDNVFFGKPKTIKTQAAGQSAPNLIYKGEKVSVEDYPFSVALILNNPALVNVKGSSYDFRKGFFCTGVLINNNTIITAAHCLIDVQNNGFKVVNDVKVVYGLSVLSGNFKTNDSINNHLYDVGSFTNLNPKVGNDDDIAIVKLKNPIKGFIYSKIVLPTSDQAYLYSKNISVDIVGFGCQSNPIYPIDNSNSCDQGVLKKITLTTVNDPNVISSINKNPTPHIIVLGHDNPYDMSNINFGDSGSAVFYTIKKGFGGARQYVLMGISVDVIPIATPNYKNYLTIATKIIDYLTSYINPALKASSH